VNIDDLILISVDDHVVEPPDMFEGHIPARYKDAAPKVVTKDDGTDAWVFEGQEATNVGLNAVAGRPPDEYGVEPTKFSEMRPGCFNPADRLADMDIGGVEASLCFPTFPRFCGQTFLERRDKDLALLCVRAYNDWMIDEWCGDSRGRLIPLCLIPLWDPQRAAEEVHRNAARGCRAIAFSENPAALKLPSIHDAERAWDPLLAACDETGTVICMHIGSSSRLTTSSRDAPAAVMSSLTHINAEISLADWLLSGHLARFPDLTIAYSEGQIGWMPYVLERVDKVWENTRAWGGVEDLVPEPPSSYFRGRVFGCLFDDTTGLVLRDRIGIDQITFEVDYPHQDSTWPDSMAIVEAFAPMLTDEELEKVLRGNAIRMLGLEREGSMT